MLTQPLVGFAGALGIYDQVIPTEANGFCGAQANGKCSWLGETFLVILFPLEGLCCSPVHLVSPEMGEPYPGDSRLLIQFPGLERPLKSVEKLASGVG